MSKLFLIGSKVVSSPNSNHLKLHETSNTKQNNLAFSPYLSTRTVQLIVNINLGSKWFMLFKCVLKDLKLKDWSSQYILHGNVDKLNWSIHSGQSKSPNFWGWIALNLNLPFLMEENSHMNSKTGHIKLLKVDYTAYSLQ